MIAGMAICVKTDFLANKGWKQAKRASKQEQFVLFFDEVFLRKRT